MTVLFSDLRNFTSILENKSPQESFDFINRYLNKTGPLIRKHQGFIDKYVGDAILALFQTEPEDALKAAIEMVKLLKMDPEGIFRVEEVEMGVGIHYGPLMVGTIGEKQRMDGTVISDAVNIASRIESLNKYYQTQIIVTEAVINSVKNLSPYHIRFVDHIYAKGKNVDLKIYEIFNDNPPEIIEKKIMFDALYQAALIDYREARFQQALEKLLECQKALPRDTVIAIYIQRCKNFIENPPSKDWNGVATLIQKTDVFL